MSDPLHPISNGGGLGQIQVEPVVSMGTHDLGSIMGAPPRPGLFGAIDQFEIIREIGRGGMGVVLLARDSTNEKLVAIKVITPELAQNPRAVHRFLVEARHMSRLAHPNIVPVLSVSERSAGPYLVMPFLERGSLAQIVTPGRPLEREQILRIARDIAEALRFAHAKGITHRDIKPDNVMLAASGEAMLADFGLARTVFNDSIVDVRESQREGTAAYMAPEIACGEAGDGRCDIYSWGALMYEMLTGQRPYDAPTNEILVRKVIESDPKPIAELSPVAPPDLTKVTEHAMARNLRDRYSTMADVISDLDRLESGSPPRLTRGRSRRWRANRWLIASAAVALVLFALLPTRLYRSVAPFVSNQHEVSQLESLSDEFNGNELDETKWTAGEKVFNANNGTILFNSVHVGVARGNLALTAGAEAEGNAFAIVGWVDSKADLSKSGDLSISIRIADATGSSGRVRISLTDESSPSNEEDAGGIEITDQMRELNAPALGTRDFNLKLYPSHKMLLISNDLSGANSNVVDLSRLTSVHLRFFVAATNSSGLPRSNVAMTVDSIKVIPLASEALFVGRVVDEKTGRPIPFCTVATADGKSRVTCTASGKFILPVHSGSHLLLVRSGKLQSKMRVEIGGGESKNLGDVLLRDDCVVQSIPFDAWHESVDALVADGSRLVYASTDVDEVSVPRVYSLHQQRDSSPESGAILKSPTGKNFAAMGMALDGGKIRCISHFTDTAIYTVDRGTGVSVWKEMNAGIAWRNGLGLDDHHIWFLERNEMGGPYSIRRIHREDTERSDYFAAPVDVISLALGGGMLWLTTREEIIGVDPRKLAQQWNDAAVVTRMPGIYTYLSYSPDGFIWAVDKEGQAFCKIQPPAISEKSRP